MKIICTTEEKRHLNNVFNQWADIPKVHGYCPFAFIYCSKIPLGDIEYGKKCRECITDHLVWEVIDNAETVKPEEVYITAKEYNLYLEGYKQGRKDFGRPQGEWKTRHRIDCCGKDVVYFECNRCGNYTVPIYHLFIDELLKVCPNCGADMRGKKNETTFDDYLKEQLKDPEFRKEWEKLRDDDMQNGGTE